MNRRTLLKSAAAMAALGSRPVQSVVPRSDGALKITGFKIHKTTLRWRSLLFLEIETDGGITGIGEGTVWRRVDQVEDALRWLEPHLTDGAYPTQKNGMVRLPEGPGLGITLDYEEFKRRFPYRGEP